MKEIILLALILFTGFNLQGQNVQSYNEFNLSFESTQKLEKSFIESDSVVSFENDNVAIDIEIIPIQFESKRFIKNPEKGAKEIARDFGLRGIESGGQLQNIGDGYFVKAYDFEEGRKYPVYIIAALNYAMGIAYEISIDGYEINESESLDIIKSFRIIE